MSEYDDPRRDPHFTQVSAAERERQASTRLTNQLGREVGTLDQQLDAAAEALAAMEASNDALRDQLVEREELLAKEHGRWWPKPFQLVMIGLVLFVIFQAYLIGHEIAKGDWFHAALDGSFMGLMIVLVAFPRSGPRDP